MRLYFVRAFVITAPAQKSNNLQGISAPGIGWRYRLQHAAFFQRITQQRARIRRTETN
jgi:hypothetical protein